MTTAQRIGGYSLGVPDGWKFWTPGEGAARAVELGEALADGAAAQARVGGAVRAFDASPGEGRVVELGVWVPDRATGEPWAQAQIELLTSPPDSPMTADAFLAAVLETPRHRGAKVFHYDTAPAETNAGPAVVVTHTIARRRAGGLLTSGPILTSIEWTIFPPGSFESVQVTFSTPVAAYAEPLVEQSARVVNYLDLSLVDA
jgi:anti-sigma factor RsiW